MSEKLTNLMVRTASAFVLGVVMLGAIIWSQWSYGVLLALLTVGGIREFYLLAEKRNYVPQRFLGIFAGLLLFALNFAFVSEDVSILGEYRSLFGAGLAMMLLLVFVMFLCELWRKEESPMANIALTIMGVCYVAVPISLLCYFPILITESWNPWIMVGYLFIIWANDVFAYLVGMTCGRHRLFERLSPKKSWEGFFGGLIGAVAFGIAAGHLLGGSLWAWGGLALVTAVTGVLGDLVESMFKRSAEVKDSGELIPGHGGVLDRFDAVLLSAPFVFVYMFFVM